MKKTYYILENDKKIGEVEITSDVKEVPMGYKQVDCVGKVGDSEFSEITLDKLGVVSSPLTGAWNRWRWLQDPDRIER